MQTPVKIKIWLICSVICASLVQATQSVCSSENTATSGGVREQFQSNGWCTNNCAGHQFAIVQGYMCWCSDTEPSTKTSVSDCNGTCPGYGYEDCGSTEESLFGYIYLGQTPLSSVESVETSTVPTTHSSSSGSTTSSIISSARTVKGTSAVTSLSLTLESIASPSSTSTSTASPSTTSPTPSSSSTTSTTPTSTSTTSSITTSSITTSTSTTSSTTTSTSTTPTSTSTTPTSTSTTPTSTSTTPASTTPTSTTPTSTSTTPTSTSTTPSSTTPSTTTSSSTTSSTTPIITSVSLQTSLKYSIVTVTSVHTMDTNVSEITSRYLTSTKIITQIYSSALTETPSSAVATTSAGTGGKTTNSNSNSNSNNNNNNATTAKSTQKKGYWHSPGKIAATFTVVGVVCALIICVLIYLIYHYRTRPARKAQDFESEYQRKFPQSKHPNEITATTLHTPSPSSSSTFSTPRLIYTDEKGQVTESPSPRQSTYSLTAGSPLNEPSTLESPFCDPTLSRKATFLHSPPQKHSDKMESNLTLGEDTVLVDQRLDPSKMLSTIANDDATTHSAVSLSDNVDYSRRVLRVMNE